MKLTLFYHLPDFPMDSSNGNCRGASSGEYITVFVVFTVVKLVFDVI